MTMICEARHWLLNLIQDNEPPIKTLLFRIIGVRGLCRVFDTNILANTSDLVQPLAHKLFGLAANLIANSYG